MLAKHPAQGISHFSQRCITLNRVYEQGHQVVATSGSGCQTGQSSLDACRITLRAQGAQAFNLLTLQGRIERIIGGSGSSSRTYALTPTTIRDFSSTACWYWYALC